MNLEELFDDIPEDIPTKKVDKCPEWIDMPSFNQEEQKPFAKIIFRFETEEDLNAFSKLIGQKLTPKTKSAWYPALERGVNSGLRWISDE